MKNLICKQCGNKKVYITAWINSDTKKYISDYNNDSYCTQCKTSVDLI